MKIAFTTSGKDMSAPMDPRFGRAAGFLIYDTDGKTFTCIENKGVDAAQGAGIKAAETIAKAGAQALVTGDCGPKAVQALAQANIHAFSCKDKSVQAALELYLAQKLSPIAA
ncbi:MAG: NifB/NifX family molybdenum-iron cluster-binding protein [Alphaproteobacteria bacterium]|nr:NifB/NifX family molybdenum-iron cluster-binding protein [Alphaproteobacteria bacterium]